MDLSGFSNEELLAIAGGGASAASTRGGSDLSGYSNEELLSIAGVEPTVGSEAAGQSTFDLLGFDPGPKAAAAMTIGGLSKILPFNFGDEIVAGGSAALDAIRGQNIGDAYDQRLSQVRNYQKAFAQENPKSNTFMEVGGAFLMPLKSKVGSQAKTTQKIVQGTKEGFSLGALFGFGGGEGAEGRAAQALTGGATNSVFGAGTAGVSVFAPKVMEAGKASIRKSIGARQTDYTKSAKDLNLWDVVDDEVATKAKEAIDSLAESGALGKSASSSKMTTAALKQEKELGEQVGKLIRGYDQSVGSPVYPTFDKALDYITSGQAGNRAPQAEKEIYSLYSRLQKEGKGKLEFLQNEKTAWGGKYEQGDDALNGFYRALYHDLKDTIEKTVPAVKPLNQELTKYKLVLPILKRGTGADEAKTWVGSLVQALRTSGGNLTTPVLIGGTIGGVTGGQEGLVAGAALGAAASPAGQRLIGNKLIQGSKGMAKAPGILPPVAAFTQGERFQESTQGQSRVRQLPTQRPPVISGSNSAQSNDETQAVFNRISGGPVKNPENDQELDLLLEAIKQVESSGGKYTTGPKTKYGVAKGAWQVLDSTGEEYHAKLGMTEPYDPYNEEQQKQIALAILQDYQRMFDGDIEKAVLAYHTGPGNVRRGKIGPQGKAYVPKVEKALRQLIEEV